MIVTQYDKGMVQKINIVDDKKRPINISGFEIECTIVKEDNTKLSNIVVDKINETNGECILVITENMTTISGLCKIYVKVYDSDEYVTSNTMLTFYVQPLDGGV